MIQLIKSYRVEIPLSWDLSKNKKFQWKTSKVLNPEYKKIKDLITFSFNLQRVQLIKKKKVWLIINVFKPTLRGDCINLIEGIADACKRSLTGIDDNLFSSLTDWHIDKEKPRIEIIIGQ